MTESTTMQVTAHGGLGAWEITIYPSGQQKEQKVIKKVVIAKNLLDVATKYPDMMEASFLGEGECLLPAGGKGGTAEA